MDKKSSLGGKFDLSSQPGVMLLLASIRASEINATEKNELRDLVFLYTNGGGDASVKIDLEQKLITYKIEPLRATEKVSVAPAPALSFGSSRPAPVFNPPVVAEKPTTPPVTPSTIPTTTPQSTTPSVIQAPLPAQVILDTPKEPVAEIPELPKPLVESKRVAQVDTISAPLKSPEQRLAENIPTQAAPVVAPQNPVPPQVQSSVAPVTQTPPLAQVVSDIPKVSTPTPAPAIAKPASGNINYLDRIREIKTSVNAKIGNPVNLVDIDNEVGREYMNALLDAMKKLNGGVAGEMDLAMSRLEKSFESVEQAIIKHNTSPTPTPVQSREPSAPAVVAPNPAPAPIAPTAVNQAVGYSDTNSVKSNVQSSPQIPVVPVATQAPFQPPTQQPSPKPISTPVQSPAPVSAPSPITPTPTPAQKPVVESVPVSPDIPVSSLKPTSTPVVPVSKESADNPLAPTSGFETPAEQVSSLAEEKKMLSLNDLPTSLPDSLGASGNPLYTSEIDEGLEQLLSDWVLFKKSGLFGTGPKGREHPLFKKMAGLHIPLILAGRFEGATQEIKQSITDYMNGWRYEQGLIYEQEETFEDYLRRVIKHILDLQRKRTPA